MAARRVAIADSPRRGDPVSGRGAAMPGRRRRLRARVVPWTLWTAGRRILRAAAMRISMLRGAEAFLDLPRVRGDHGRRGRLVCLHPDQDATNGPRRHQEGDDDILRRMGPANCRHRAQGREQPRDRPRPPRGRQAHSGADWRRERDAEADQAVPEENLPARGRRAQARVRRLLRDERRHPARWHRTHGGALCRGAICRCQGPQQRQGDAGCYEALGLQGSPGFARCLSQAPVGGFHWSEPGSREGLEGEEDGGQDGEQEQRCSKSQGDQDRQPLERALRQGRRPRLQEQGRQDSGCYPQNLARRMLPCRCHGPRADGLRRCAQDPRGSRAAEGRTGPSLGEGRVKLDRTNYKAQEASGLSRCMASQADDVSSPHAAPWSARTLQNFSASAVSKHLIRYTTLDAADSAAAAGPWGLPRAALPRFLLTGVVAAFSLSPSTSEPRAIATTLRSRSETSSPGAGFCQGRFVRLTEHCAISRSSRHSVAFSSDDHVTRWLGSTTAWPVPILGGITEGSAGVPSDSIFQTTTRVRSRYAGGRRECLDPSGLAALRLRRLLIIPPSPSS